MFGHRQRAADHRKTGDDQGERPQKKPAHRLDRGSVASRAVRSKLLLFASPSLWYLVWQPQQTNVPPTPHCSAPLGRGQLGPLLSASGLRGRGRARGWEEPGAALWALPGACPALAGAQSSSRARGASPVVPLHSRRPLAPLGRAPLRASAGPSSPGWSFPHAQATNTTRRLELVHHAGQGNDGDRPGFHLWANGFYVSILSLTLHFLSGLATHLSELPAVEWTHISKENVRAERILLLFLCYFEQMRKLRPRKGKRLVPGLTAIWG